ncbi:MAG: hypothetical protein CVT88_04595 [Candidatus Altiarchaeales archaeon HGW-Altiarchaeales-1]|nr:MAG: hypothetical protein CVT88_04595 [Candidatus Altiarchaeales archaeon HGW-Altiarchaeales-1]
MRLINAQFENIMELQGEMAFPDNKIVVIYGSNKSGKSNIIHTIRYAFLSKTIRFGKKSGYDELQIVTSNEMAPSKGVGKIVVEFEHNNKQYKIKREIDRYRDACWIERKENCGNTKLEFNDTLNKELKIGLLNALFAPDSAMGFDQLNERNIDAVIRELFKEIGNAKDLSNNFRTRIKKLKEGSSARISSIEREYKLFISKLTDELKNITINLSDLDKYEPSQTSEKIYRVSEDIRIYVDSVEKGDLKEFFQDNMIKNNYLNDLKRLLLEEKNIKNRFNSIKDISDDEYLLKQLIDDLIKVENIEISPPNEIKRFCDNNLNKQVENTYQKLKDAQTLYRQAVTLAEKEGLDIKLDNPQKFKSEKEKVLCILDKDVNIMEGTLRIKADLVKIDDAIHAIIPLKLIKEDSSFSKINPQPIPEGPEKEKREYVNELNKSISNLGAIYKNKEDSDKLFRKFRDEMVCLERYRATMQNNKNKEDKEILDWIVSVSKKLLLFSSGKDIKIPKKADFNEVDAFISEVKGTIQSKKLEYKNEINQKLKPLSIIIEEFDISEINSCLMKLKNMEVGIHVYKNILTDLTKEKRREWEKIDAEYIDLIKVPIVSNRLDKILTTILDNIFDEQEIINGIQEIIVEINDLLITECLVNACIEMNKDSLLVSKIIYKNKEITHPSGAERSFFSLAALTALAVYFRLPVIIDEAANNLDKDNLQLFIHLVRQFMDKYGVQYIISIKETNDFPLDGGWVDEFKDDLQIYKIEYDGDKKYISLATM